MNDSAKKLSNLSRMKSRLGGSTPNLSMSQQQNLQRGFDCTAAERSQQLRETRGILSFKSLTDCEILK